MTEQPVITPAPTREAIYDNHLVKVVGEPNTAGRVKIQWSDSRAGLKESYAHKSELTYMEDKLPPAILDLVQRVHKGFEFSFRIFAQQYTTLLRTIHATNQKGESFRVYSELHAPQAGRLRSDCAVLLRGGFLEERHVPGATDYRLSKLACTALGVDYISLSSPAEKPQPAVIAQAEAVVEQVTARQPVEIKTLIQFLDKEKERGEADREFANHLNASWRLMDIAILPGAIRVVTLQRWPEPAPQPRAAVEAAAVIEEPAPLVEPVGPTVIITGARQPEPVLNLGPYGRSIRDSGLDETLAIANDKAAQAGRAAFEQALASAAIPVRPLIPETVNND